MNNTRAKWFVWASSNLTFQGSESITLNFFAGRERDIDDDVKRMEENKEDKEVLAHYKTVREAMIAETGDTKYVESRYGKTFSISIQHNLDNPNYWYAARVSSADLHKVVFNALNKLVDMGGDGTKAIEILKAKHVKSLKAFEWVLRDEPELLRKK